MSEATGPPVSRRTVLRTAAVGGAGAAGIAGTAGTATAQATDLGTWFEGVTNYDGVDDRTGSDEVTVIVGASGNGGNLAFGPPAIRVDPGTTVVWRWSGKGGGHNVRAEATGEGSDPLFDSGTPVSEQGITFTYTFEESGVYRYVCSPHRGAGMKGAVVVGDVEVDEGVAPAGDGGGPAWRAPGGEFTSVFYGLWLGAAALAALSVVGTDAYAAVKNGALDRVAGYEPIEEPEGPVERTAEADSREPAVSIGHDEFDPVGTATLIVVYFLILVGMWVFVYFVEFLGNGPTVTG